MTKKYIPDFVLQYASINPGERGKAVDYLKAQLTNWLKLHAYIGSLGKEISFTRVNVMANLMLLEYQRKGGPRMDIIARLYGRFSTLRHEAERVALGTRITR